jgi:hypothetical protein
MSKALDLLSMPDAQEDIMFFVNEQGAQGRASLYIEFMMQGLLHALE